MTDDASAKDKVAVTFSRGSWPVGPDEEFPFVEPDLAHHTVPEPVSTPPWRQVARPPAWPVWPVMPTHGPDGVEAGPAATAAGSAGPATAELRLDFDAAFAGASPQRPHDPPPEHPPGSSWEHPYGLTREHPPGPPPGEHRPGPPPDYAHGPSWARRAWLGLVAAAVLVLTVAAGFALSPRSAKGHAASDVTSVHGATAARQPAPVGTTAGAAAANPADPTSAASDPTRAPSTAPAPARPVTVTYEAETGANKMSGSAFVTNYQGASGGRVVKNLGDWKNPAGPGSLTFTNVTVPVSGAYVLVFFYVHANGDPSRTAVITVGGANPIDVTVSGGSACCARQAVDLTLTAGKNAISFGNPKGPAPAIDKIEIMKAAAG
jgi:hypothetical protein